MNTQAVINYLQKQQAADGSFDGAASPSVTPFVARRKQPTIFPTALILDCLREVIGTEDIRLRAAKYLEGQVSEVGSWNYWDKNSDARQEQPYPDDLDDTACALAALTRSGTPWVDGFRLGQFARLLVTCEQKPGGPYNTWLVDTAKATQWRDADLAVNANIGYALSLQSVQVRGLMEYLDEALAHGTLTSSYYVGELPVLYFLSRWYRGEQFEILVDKATKCVANNVATLALERALLLSAACRLGLPKCQLAGLADSLQKLATGSHWPAEALYLDPVYDGQQHYGGSAALTTALALEALTAYANLTVESPVVIARKRGVPPIMADVRKDAASITNERLRRRYLATARRIMQDTAGEQITAPASIMDHAGGWKTPSVVTSKLNLASLNGWMAYTVYDDFLDDRGEVKQLNVANVALRRSYAYCLAALPNYANWAEYVGAVFDIIDSANDWEQQHARAAVHGGKITLTKLPDYAALNQLADRSWGHGLAATGVAFAHYHSLDDLHMRALQTFFRHFLIARQLNDDAHDWEEDLRAGHLSAVLTMLLESAYELPRTVKIVDELDSLRQYFWQHTISEVVKLIRSHLSSAEQALKVLAEDIDTTVFMGWLDTLETAVTAALTGRDEALQFMQAYEGSHANK